jgi:hypothetical protein
VLEGVRSGLPFEAAFARAAGGVTLREEESAWSQSLGGPLRWLAWASAEWTVWILMTALVLMAWLLQRLRTRRILKRWEEEDRFEDPGGL